MLIEELVGKEAKLKFEPRHPADMMANWANISKAKQILGWCARDSFQDGVERLVVWYLENRSWAKDIKTT